MSGHLSEQTKSDALFSSIDREHHARDNAAFEQAMREVELENAFRPDQAFFIRQLLASLSTLETTIIGLEARLAEAEIGAPLRPNRRTIADMVAFAAHKVGITPAMVRGEGRSANEIMARFAVAWVARRLTHHSTTVIGKALGNRDHSTIVSAIQRAELRRRADTAFETLTDAMLHAFSPAGEQ